MTQQVRPVGRSGFFLKPSLRIERGCSSTSDSRLALRKNARVVKTQVTGDALNISINSIPSLAELTRQRRESEEPTFNATISPPAGKRSLRSSETALFSVLAS